MRYRALIVALLALCLGFLTACSEGPANATTELTYEQIRGTGLANTCPKLDDTSRGSIPLERGKTYVLKELCMEPTSFFVKEESTNKRREPEFIAGKPMTRLTSSLDQVSGKLKVESDGSLTFIEEEGFDFQPITVKLPNGELVPFLFTIKGLVAKSQPGLEGINTSTDFEGEYRVPSYRTSNFLDPKGRGLTTGYDNAVALPSRADDEELLKENLKRFETGKGRVSLQVAKVNNATGEIAGTFVSLQPSDTDMGGKEPLDVKIRGLFYARVEPS
ncbi:MAG: photosystem II manganese-stabilizing polypeptide [Synechococcales cyanobacterium C42_A2020_086]|jgi:photosystem II oxygen-evolving enhancer protein 1|nr:photosystem II manganese-stabilizing polypeptide [Synechococcales cyanobacterium M58_A2018_015]MBF2073967.1 photosystem II manganese-stabilizing polypeptide [Synechococcales cyanobacterium C42_A2020_086]